MMALDKKILNENSAENFVAKTWNASWDGWDIVMFTPSPRAYFKKNGVYSREHLRWGFEERTSPDARGNWTVLTKRSAK